MTLDRALAQLRDADSLADGFGHDRWNYRFA
jgi:hypothetical protein